MQHLIEQVLTFAEQHPEGAPLAAKTCSISGIALFIHIQTVAATPAL